MAATVVITNSAYVGTLRLMVGTFSAATGPDDNTISTGFGTIYGHGFSVSDDAYPVKSSVSGGTVTFNTPDPDNSAGGTWWALGK